MLMHSYMWFITYIEDNSNWLFTLKFESCSDETLMFFNIYHQYLHINLPLPNFHRTEMSRKPN
jgi:hypothetical protein